MPMAATTATATLWSRVPIIGGFFYYQPALQRASMVEVKVPQGLKIGYIMGAGDDIPDVLRELGLERHAAHRLTRWRARRPEPLSERSCWAFAPTTRATM